MEFWLDKGVAGFRFSSVGKLYEHKDFPDEPRSFGREKWPVYYSLIHKYTYDQPEVIDTVIEWRKFVDDYSRRKNTFPRYSSKTEREVSGDRQTVSDTFLRARRKSKTLRSAQAFGRRIALPRMRVHPAAVFRDRRQSCNTNTDELSFHGHGARRLSRRVRAQSHSILVRRRTGE